MYRMYVEWRTQTFRRPCLMSHHALEIFREVSHFIANTTVVECAPRFTLDSIARLSAVLTELIRLCAYVLDGARARAHQQLPELLRHHSPARPQRGRISLARSLARSRDRLQGERKEGGEGGRRKGASKKLVCSVSDIQPKTGALEQRTNSAERLADDFPGDQREDDRV